MTSICRFWTLICRNKHIAVYFTLLPAILLLYSNQALAQKSLNFRDAETFKEKQALALLHPAPHMLARVDLNGDFIDEYVVRPRNCVVGSLCSHGIIAYEDGNPLIIGEFATRKILLLPEKTYGIHHLRIFNQALNDFAYQDAVWSPHNFRFEYLE